MIVAFFVLVGELVATSLVYAFLRHDWRRGKLARLQNLGRIKTGLSKVKMIYIERNSSARRKMAGCQ